MEILIQRKNLAPKDIKKDLNTFNEMWKLIKKTNKIHDKIHDTSYCPHWDTLLSILDLSNIFDASKSINEYENFFIEVFRDLNINLPPNKTQIELVKVYPYHLIKNIGEFPVILRENGHIISKGYIKLEEKDNKFVWVFMDDIHNKIDENGTNFEMHIKEFSKMLFILNDCSISNTLDHWNLHPWDIENKHNKVGLYKSLKNDSKLGELDGDHIPSVGRIKKLLDSFLNLKDIIDAESEIILKEINKGKSESINTKNKKYSEALKRYTGGFKPLNYFQEFSTLKTYLKANIKTHNRLTIRNSINNINEKVKQIVEHLKKLTNGNHGENAICILVDNSSHTVKTSKFDKPDKFNNIEDIRELIGFRHLHDVYEFYLDKGVSHLSIFTHFILFQTMIEPLLKLLSIEEEDYKRRIFNLLKSKFNN